MLSIVIPTFNEEKYLPGLLRCLQEQTFKDYELIVADNDSSDATRSIAVMADARVVGGGLPGRGRNLGAEVAQGEWLLFLDADVILPFDFLEKAMLELEQKGFFVASCFVDPLSDRKIDRVLHDAVNLGFKATRKIYPHAPGFCIFIRRWCHELVGGFNEKLMLAEDNDYVLQASKLCRFGLLESVRIMVSVRRLDRDGRFNVSMKYLASDAYRIFLGPIESNIFNYQYGYPEKQTSGTGSR